MISFFYITTITTTKLIILSQWEVVQNPWCDFIVHKYVGLMDLCTELCSWHQILVDNVHWCNNIVTIELSSSLTSYVEGGILSKDECGKYNSARCSIPELQLSSLYWNCHMMHPTSRKTIVHEIYASKKVVNTRNSYRTWHHYEICFSSPHGHQLIFLFLYPFVWIHLCYDSHLGWHDWNIISYRSKLDFCGSRFQIPQRKQGTMNSSFNSWNYFTGLA